MRNQKKYPFYPRWKMTLLLSTASPLHIGSGEVTHRDALKIQEEGQEGDGRKADINACIKDGKGQPFIPGSTIKGNVRQWLEQHLVREPAALALCRKVLGHGKGNDAKSAGGAEPEQGGTAEFLAGTLSKKIVFSDQEITPAYWDPATQTAVETAIAVNRVTRTAADKKLFYQEVVPAGAGFTLTVVGTMPREQAALLAASLKAGFTDAQPITFGGDTANGGGRMQFEQLQVSSLDREEIAQWLTRQDGVMAEAVMRPFLRKEQASLLAEGGKWLKQADKAPHVVTINLRFAGPFLVNDPSRCKKPSDMSGSNHVPLQEKNGDPILPAKSVRGALRSQAEKILRTLSKPCCDPEKPCPPVYSVADVQGLCPVCRLFGSTGWQSRIRITQVAFQGSRLSLENELLHKQDFVAIDRFHGGSRDTAKFDAAFFQSPAFTITLELDPDLDEQAKGLLALTLRDLEEGDIFFGFGRSKGYGKILAEETTITGGEFLVAEENLTAFREQSAAESEDSQALPCLSRNEPDAVSPSGQSGKQGVVKGQQGGDGPTFHNPYHFIPVTAPKTATWLAREDFGSRMHDSHALYRDKDDSNKKGKKILHGRIRCTLTSETPLFIGGKRNDGEPEHIDHFNIDSDPAIPATSLRGMLSSVTEAASNSALRVLDDAMMSCRHKIGEESLSAIGMVLIEDGQHYLYPLTLPLYDNRDQDSLSAYRAMFPEGKEGPLKVYLENAHRHGAMGGFIAGATTWNLRHPQIYYLPEASQGDLKKAGSRVLGRRYAGLVPTTTRTAATDQPGILRVLGKNGRGSDIPATKKHELFLPIPDNFAANPRGFIDGLKKDGTELFAIPPEVIATFEQLADQRTRPQIKHPAGITPTQWQPFHLQGCSRNDGRSADIDPHQMRLQEGDLVYFRPFSGSPRQVAKISFSSIWRSRVPKTVHKYFSEELLPFNQNREHISPAELLFGFVQQEKEQGAFAGKTVFSSGLLQKGQHALFMEKEVTLKILSNPKLPSPALYFDGPGYVAKHGMQSGNIKPQGRKQYLHAWPNAADPQGVKKISQTGSTTKDGPYPWESRHGEDFANQKVRIRPLRKGVQFSFTVDFDNCTEWELGLLLYALRPTKDYRHKIGMGKPLGLGSVQIAIEGVGLIDRKKRYAKDSLDAARYNEVLSSDQESLAAWRTRFADSMEPEIRHALELLGNPASVDAPVHYPQVQGADIEKENFRWFVANEKKGSKGADYLVPLSQSVDTLPVLHRHRE